MSRNLKLVVWHIVVALVALGFWFDLAKWLEAVSLEKDFASYAVILFGFLAAMIVLGFAMFRKKWLTLSFGGLTWLGFLLNFGFSDLNHAGLIILILVYAWSRDDVYSESAERLKIKSRFILRRGLLPVILGLFILISFAAYQSPAFDNLKDMTQLPPETEKYLKVVVENTIGHRLEGASEKEKQQVINAVSKETFVELNNLFGPYFKYAPPILAFTLFLILWGLSWLFVWISVGLGVLVFWILKKGGFIKIEEQEVKAQVLVL